MRRRLDRDAAKLAYLDARQRGLGVRDAASAAGVHVATVCRWRHVDPAFAALVRETAVAEPAELYYHSSRPNPDAPKVAALPPRPLPLPRDRPSGRPPVPVHRDCPACGGRAEVRKVGRHFGPPFWRCSRWLMCTWASWRPRHPADCPDCGGPRFWSHSRQSVACGRCRTRSCGVS
jgi:hypothetical protein